MHVPPHPRTVLASPAGCYATQGDVLHRNPAGTVPSKKVHCGSRESEREDMTPVEVFALGLVILVIVGVIGNWWVHR